MSESESLQEKNQLVIRKHWLENTHLHMPNASGESIHPPFTPIRSFLCQ